MVLLNTFFAVSIFFTCISVVSYFIRGGISIDTLLEDARAKDGIISYVSAVIVVGFLYNQLVGAVPIYALSLATGIINLGLVFILGRRRTTNVTGFLISVIFATGVAVLVDRYGNVHHYSLYEVVFVVAVLFFALQNPVRHFDSQNAYVKDILVRYKRLKSRYSVVVETNTPNDPVLRRLLFSIMIAEDFNRPRLLRVAELPLLLIKRPMTLGIMQTSSSRPVSNNTSVALAAKKITGSYLKRVGKNKTEYSLIKTCAADYNGGVYPDIIVEIYYTVLENIDQ